MFKLSYVFIYGFVAYVKVSLLPIGPLLGHYVGEGIAKIPTELYP